MFTGRSGVTLAWLGLALWLGTLPAWGQGSLSGSGSQVGVVDLDVLIMFHPQMAWFVPEQKVFLRQPGGGRGVVDRDVARRRAGEEQDVSAAVHEERRRLEARVDEIRNRLDRQRKEAEDALLNMTRGYDSKKDVGRLEAARNMYKVQIARIESEAARELRTIELQMVLNDDKVAAAQKNMDTPDTLSPAESERVLFGIMAEIRNAVAMAAARRNLSVVFDANAGILPRYLLGSDPAERLTADNPYARLLGARVDERMSQDVAAARGAIAGQGNLAAEWYRERFAVLAGLRNKLQDGAVVVGGIDLTADALVAILSARGVSRQMQGVILQAIRDEKAAR